MLQVSFYVTEKKLAQALWSLDGIAQGQPEIKLIRGAKATANGNIKPVARDGSLTQTVIKMLRGKEHVNSAELAAMLAKAGGSKKGIGSLTAKLRHANLIRSLGQGKGYQVIG